MIHKIDKLVTLHSSLDILPYADADFQCSEGHDDNVTIEEIGQATLERELSKGQKFTSRSIEDLNQSDSEVVNNDAKCHEGGDQITSLLF